mmetsp:Transcript_18085/g.20889  ORF Transcript_18085/g.20889 Transcript_18085/m.20889 type:complete len:305 (+) Transcript_18085:147-1061(+)|eukprot:CAMPEP_0184015236 /NCGR_PEP_ID=MMETSP0954-20121128/6178_1 /TAXON_ID=627963 /ORGANISM="Aplanochytrium sp, Strain PBS07" /LENGTH=304 /DNA_ID=CAMNT_0026295957 /DNA_START=1583 /DNA_END=2497 /DNA_ORIENTATION=+
MGMRSLQLERQILSVYDNVKDPILPSSPDVDGFCDECGFETEVIHDVSAGDIVCTNCGCVIKSHTVVETVFGKGLGGYGFGTTDSAKLDMLTGQKAKENGKTRKWYKFLLKRAANEEMDALCDDSVVRDFAKILFEKYTDRLEKVHDRQKVIDACLAAAESRVRRVARRGRRELLSFNCSNCGERFDCKKARRVHTCIETEIVQTRRSGRRGRVMKEAVETERKSPVIKETIEAERRDGLEVNDKQKENRTMISKSQSAVELNPENGSRAVSKSLKLLNGNETSKVKTIATERTSKKKRKRIKL